MEVLGPVSSTQNPSRVGLKSAWLTRWWNGRGRCDPHNEMPFSVLAGAGGAIFSESRSNEPKAKANRFPARNMVETPTGDSGLSR